MSREIQRRPAEIVVDHRGKELSTHVGRYSDKITVDLARKHQGKIVSVRKIVGVQYGSMNERNETYVRNRLTVAVNMLLKAGIPAIPVYEEHGHHKKIGIKVITEYNVDDYDALTEYKDAAVARGDISHAKAAKVAEAMATLRAALEGNSE